MSLYCLPLIRGRLPGLRPSEQKVARFIMGNPEDVVNMSSVELGSAAGVSESTVIKCSQRLGFEGFVQLKLALARDLAVAPTTAFGEVEQGDAPDIVIQKIFNANSAALSDTSKVLDPEQLGEAAALDYWRDYGGFEMILITDDERVICTGGLRDSFTLYNEAYTLTFSD